jgi:hypothetical protein
MKFLKYALFAAVACFVAGVVLHAAPASRKEFRIRISGTPGLILDGHYEVEGRRSGFRGTIPAEVTVTARSLDYTVRTAGGEGQLQVELLLDGVPFLAASATSPGAAVRGYARRRFLAQRFGTYTIRDEPRPIGKHPPPVPGPAR